LMSIQPSEADRMTAYRGYEVVLKCEAKRRIDKALASFLMLELD
jgi:hypothetical protein